MNTYKVGQGRQTTSAIALIALASLAPLRLPTGLQLYPQFCYGWIETGLNG